MTKTEPYLAGPSVQDSPIFPTLVANQNKCGAVVRALSSHHCVARTRIRRGVDAICGLSLLLVLSLAQRGFFPGTLVFPSP